MLHLIFLLQFKAKFFSHLSRSVQKTVKTKKKLNGGWWLYRKFSGLSELFSGWRCLKSFFKKRFRIKFCIQISSFFYFFYLGSMAPKNGTKAGITRVWEELWPKFFHQKLDHFKEVPKKWSYWPLDLWVLDPFLLIKTPNTAKSNCIFHSKLRPDRALIFGYSDSPINKSFLWDIYFFQFCTHSWGKLGPKLDQKRKLLVCPAVVKLRIFTKSVTWQLHIWEEHLWSKFQPYSTLFSRVIAQKTPKLGPIGTWSKKN